MLKLDPISKFKDDHRKVRDMLFELIDAISRRDSQKALKILSDLDRFVGPHFRWEEESLYLMFEKFFGREYLEYLLGVHDRIVKRAKELVEILSKGEITDEQAKKLVDVVRFEILSHPIECDGITLFADKLTQEELKKLVEDLERVERENIPLLEWAERIKDAARKERGLKAKVLA
jgi:polyhydroxyalkanoate synthesis regulator phasin